MERVTLLVNHVLAAEPAATSRLAPHAGRTIHLQLSPWPASLPALPDLRVSVTPAGLLEWQECADALPADLELTVDVGDPLGMVWRGLGGERPAVSVAGDAALAGDVSWLMDNLRWDLREDLVRIVGPTAAEPIAKAAAAVARAVREAVRALQGAAQRLSPDGTAGPAEPPAR